STRITFFPSTTLFRSSKVNEVYATYLDRDTYFDGRLQQFQELGDVARSAQGAQGSAVPALRFEHIEELGEGNGRIEVSGRLLGEIGRASRRERVATPA